MKNNITISKMIIYIDKIIDYSKGISYDEFSNNTILVEACVFNLGQMGELVNKADKEFKRKYPEIPWQQLYGLRNRIVHDYEGVNLILVWDIIQDDLLPVRKQLMEIKNKI